MDRPDSTTRRRKSRLFSSLHFQASFFVVLVILAVAVADTIMHFRAMSALLYRTEHSHSQQWVQSVAAGVAGLIESNNVAELQETAGQLIREKDVAYVIFAAADGRVIASAEAYHGALEHADLHEGHTARIDEVGQASIISNPWTKFSWIDVIAPAWPKVVRDHPVGYVQLAVDIAGTQVASSQIGAGFRLSRIAIVVIAVIVSLVLLHLVFRPIDELSRAASALAKGDRIARADVRTSNEIGELAETFNTMAQRVARTQEDLERLNVELEQRVEQRTRELQELATRDPLTGLYNRRYFGEAMAHEFAMAGRYDHDLTCLMFDLDLFKDINDHYGHRAGDEVLCALADAIMNCERETDVAARFGGDEFIILMPRTSADDASALTERICGRFKEIAAERVPDAATDVSVGVASLRITRASSAESLIQRADEALYAAKSARRREHARNNEHPLIATT